MVVSRAVIRDMFAPAQAQKVMSQVTIYFGVAPAVAPLIGGWLFVHLDWHSIFWFLTLVGAALWAANYKLLPETLHLSHRQPFEVKHLMRGYWQLGSNPRFLLLALSSCIPFNGMFLYVLSAPAFLGEHLQLAPPDFFWLFLLTIAGIMTGAWLSGRMAGRLPPKQQIRYGFSVMLLMSVVNVAANFVWVPQASWAMFPIALFALVLDLYPERRGMASSLQAFVGSTANGIVAGVVAPLVMHSTRALAVTSLGMLGIGLLAWLYLHRRWPEIGRSIETH
jgi:DHA1 family bicyclomycin/chloramphenicol resistance-like MFS transporter